MAVQSLSRLEYAITRTWPRRASTPTPASKTITEVLTATVVQIPGPEGIRLDITHVPPERKAAEIDSTAVTRAAPVARVY